MRLSSAGESISAGVIAFGLAFVGLATDLGAQESGGQIPRGARLRIETSRSTYHSGDSIAVRLTLINPSSQPLKVLHLTPMAIASLVVMDAAGREIEPTAATAFHFSSGPPSILAPNSEVTIRGRGGEWVNLRDWGYDLRSPGEYTIVGTPLVEQPSPKIEAKRVRSDAATFTIDG